MPYFLSFNITLNITCFPFISCASLVIRETYIIGYVNKPYQYTFFYCFPIVFSFVLALKYQKLVL